VCPRGEYARYRLGRTRSGRACECGRWITRDDFRIECPRLHVSCGGASVEGPRDPSYDEHPGDQGGLPPVRVEIPPGHHDPTSRRGESSVCRAAGVLRVCDRCQVARDGRQGRPSAQRPEARVKDWDWSQGGRLRVASRCKVEGTRGGEGAQGRHRMAPRPRAETDAWVPLRTEPHALCVCHCICHGPWGPHTSQTLRAHQSRVQHQLSPPVISQHDYFKC